MNIADLFFQFRGTSDQLLLDAEKSGKAAGQKAATSFSGTMNKALRTGVGIALGAAFGAATAGAVQLDAATRQLQADTGMTADEANRAQKALASMYRGNLQGFDEIGQTMARVHNDLQLTGDEADRTTRAFLRFGTATGQNAAQAVERLDDIVDNWGLTAEDAQGVMDRLIVSHQKWGGNIEANETTLAKLAPAMRAANFEIDDGIALLGLFGAKGLDSERAAAAFSKAVNQVKSPEELQQLITDISNTEDPFVRAQKAADLFGVKAGAQLANALGGANLDDYTVSMEEAAGATEEAADAIESGFGAQFRLLIKNAGGALAEFGTQFGGLLMVASAFGPMMLAKIGAAFGGIAGLLAPRVAKVLAPVFDKGITMALTTLATSQTIGRAMDGLGSFMGSKLGKGLGVAFAAVAVFEVIETYNRINRELNAQSEAIGKNVANQIATGTLEQLQQSKAALERGIADLGGVFDAGIFTNEQRARLQADLDAVNANIAARMAETTDSVTTDVESMRGNIAADLADVRSETRTTGTEFGKLKQSAGKEAPKVVQYFAWMVDELVQQVDRAISDVFVPLRAQQELTAANAETAEARKVLASKKSTPEMKEQARQQIIDAAQRTAEAMKILAANGQANSAAYQTGLKTLKDFQKDLGGEATAAGRKVLELRRELARLRDAAANPIQVDVILNRLTTTGRGVQRQHGGALEAGQLALVGERGPELWVPETAGYVVDHQTTERVLAAEPGGTTNITVALPVSPPPDPFRTADALRRLVDFGVLRPRGAL